VDLAHELDHLEVPLGVAKTLAVCGSALATGDLDVSALLADDSVTDRALAQAPRPGRAAVRAHRAEDARLSHAPSSPRLRLREGCARRGIRADGHRPTAGRHFMTYFAAGKMAPLPAAIIVIYVTNPC